MARRGCALCVARSSERVIGLLNSIDVQLFHPQASSLFYPLCHAVQCHLVDPSPRGRPPTTLHTEGSPEPGQASFLPFLPLQALFCAGFLIVLSTHPSLIPTPASEIHQICSTAHQPTPSPTRPLSDETKRRMGKTHPSRKARAYSNPSPK